MKNVPLFVVALVALLLSVCASAQDFITTRKGATIEATDVIFGPSRISYRLYSDPTGPMQFIDTADVESIYYENGEKQLLRASTTAPGKGVHYADIKDLYNHKDYVPAPGDRYNPDLMGALSIIPGLGQCVEGEWGTGLLMFFGDAACWYTAIQTLKIRDDVLEDGTKTHSVKPTLGTVFFGGCALAIIGFSVFDAMRIAKVKNMYYRVEPFVASAPSGTGTSAGLSLRLNF